MKKIVLFLLVFLFLTGCGKKGKLIEINFNEYIDKINKEETFVLVVGKKQCNYCTRFKETLNEIFEEYQVEIYYIDIATFSDSEKSRFMARISFSDNEISTPTTVYIENGFEKSFYDRIEGNQSKKKTLEYLRKKGLID